MRRPALWRALALLALGAVVALGQAPWGAWYAAIPALSLIFWCVARAPGWRIAARRGWWAGTGHFAAAMFWIVDPFLVEPERHGWMAPFALLMMAGGMALFWALAAGIGRRIGGVLAVALALVASDALRGWIFTGLPWALTGHVLIGTPAMQIAAWGGALALSVLVCVAAALPVIGRGARGQGVGAVAGFTLIALAFGLGSARLAQPVAAPDGPVVRLIQPNAAQHLKWDPVESQVIFDRSLAMTAAPGQLDRPALILWPETAVNFLLDMPGAGLAMISEAAGGAPVALGIQRLEGRRFYNSLAMIDAGGQIGAVYDKFHLVPFGEYIPLEGVLMTTGLSAFAAQNGGGYSAGPGPAVIDLGPGQGGRMQPLICYEAIFPRHVRGGSDRPDWLFNATNDAWFGQAAGPYQHLAQARLRAVENGLPVLRAANTGVSAVIDGRGRLLASLPLGQAGFIDHALPAPLPPTLYARLGDGPLLAVLVLALLALALRRRPA
ncbi:apolipoprotein N-acyltransferase [Paracoccus sp. p4-l81]|uniref:apolipoprotein N-acyltransferase n=1 Tax=Paracoccus sp. p4-l81 TaxID=3342806 RepID=UPI0035B6B9C2